MLDYLQKFNNLPEDVREKISSAQVMARISELEGKYGISLAAVVMKVMVDDVKLVDLAKYFVFEFGLDGRVASELVEEMKAKVFSDVSDFLGIITDSDRANEAEADMRLQKERLGVRSSSFFFSPEDEEEVQNLAKNVDDDPVMSGKSVPTVDEKVEFVMIESNVSFGSDELNSRFRQIIKTFIKGIRNRIDAKQALMRPVADGGLGMNINSVERIIFISEQCKRELAGMPIAPIPMMKLPEDIIRLTGPAEQPELPKQTVPAAPIQGRDIAYDFSALASSAKKEVEPAKPKHTFRVGVEQLVSSTKSPQAEMDPWAPKIVDEKPIPAESRVEVAPSSVVPTANALVIPVTQPIPNIAQSEVKSEINTDKNQDSIVSRPIVAPIVNANFGLDAFPSPEKTLQESKKAVIVPSITEVPVVNLKSVDEKPKVENLANLAETPPMAPIRIISPVVDGKKKMDDIKYVPKLVGPVDEFREMNLVNFRRMSERASEAVAKLKKRLDLFEEEEGYGKRLEAIKAWRQSPVNAIYLAMGQEAIIQKGGVNGAIKTRQEKGQDYLSEEEFDAIMEFNKAIRF